MGVEVIFLIAILVVSVVIHEVAHGFAANYLGDPTAKLQGRLTLNPVSHIDPMGSIVLPAILALSSSPFLFGWAKPVPYNPYNLQRGGRWSEAMVAFAGPAANIAIALIFGIFIRFGALPASMVSLAVSIVFLNILLAVFNLIPIPPLDGSKILPQLLPRGLALQYERIRVMLEGNILLGFGIVLVFILLFGSQFATVISAISRFIIGA
ncbi:site-2 protease family protein [bacterium]|nr:site-2 protease family protein [bacterium]|tara:strand:+ start:17416 stop:18042 length:627 start_codon:yes stop_codon:yes gene_type:complete